MEDEIVEVEGLVELEDETQVESLEEDLGTELMADDKGKEVEGDHQHICCPGTKYWKYEYELELNHKEYLYERRVGTKNIVIVCCQLFGCLANEY